MNFTPRNIFDYRGQILTTTDGNSVSVSLPNGSGWTLRRNNDIYAEGVDVWAACRFLNEAGELNDMG